MTDWRKTISSIFASGIIIAGFTTGINIFYNDFYNKPHISPEWNFSKDATTITIKNDGRVAATHLILTLQTSQNMTKNSPHIFHTVNVIKTEKINSTLLQINVPSFPTGDGSTIKVVIWFVTKPIGYPNFFFYAIYDQGSIKIIAQKPLMSVEAFANGFGTYWISIILIIIGIIILSRLWIPVKNALFSRSLRRHQQQYEQSEYRSASEILFDVLTVQDFLKDQFEMV